MNEIKGPRNESEGRVEFRNRGKKLGGKSLCLAGYIAGNETQDPWLSISLLPTRIHKNVAVMLGLLEDGNQLL